MRKKLKNKYNVLIFIGPLEKKFTDIFNDFIVIKDVNLIKLAGAISLCDVFVSNDTGPVHMAAALNVSTITLFSTGDDKSVGALIDKKTFIKRDNINDITVDEVLQKLKLLKTIDFHTASVLF